MIDRGQVFVRAQHPETGKFFSCDVLDLDDESFRRWIVERVAEGRAIRVVREDPNIVPAHMRKEPRPYISKPDVAVK